MFLAASTDQFNDVPKDHWAYKAVNELSKVGIIDGYSDKSYQGDKTMTRYEMAQIVEKAMDNSNKANAKQKALIDKLASEFALELNNIDTRVTKVEKFTQSTAKLSFDTLMTFTADNTPGSTDTQLRGNDRFHLRARLIVTGDLNDKTSYTGRLATQFGTAGMEYSSTSQNNTVVFERAFFKTKDALGFDTVIWGRQPIDELGGNIIHKGGNNDGVILSKNLSSATNLRLGWLDIKAQPSTGETGNAQDIKYISMQSKVSPKLTISGLILNNDSQTNKTDTALNYSTSGSNIKGISVQYKLGPWTMLGEYDWVHLGDPVNVDSNPHGYAFQITTGTVGTNLFIFAPLIVTDFNKPGDHAITFAYRNNEAGATPAKLGSWSGGTIVSPTYKGINGKTFNGQDGIKGWLVDYQYVVAKGIEMGLTYQNLKWSKDGAPFDKNIMLAINTKF